nr:hypothetical protein [uncultured Hyphomonas sp.]
MSVAHLPLSAIISVTAALLALAAWRYRSTILRIRLAPTLFSGARQDWTFSHIAEIFPTVEIPAATRRIPFPEAEYQDLPESFDFEGQSWDTDTFLEDTDTAAMLVLKDGEIIHETYAGAGGRTDAGLAVLVGCEKLCFRPRRYRHRGRPHPFDLRSVDGPCTGPERLGL